MTNVTKDLGDVLLSSALASASSSPSSSVWQASLDLRFARREDGTQLVSRAHEGPLRVQKTFHPEGADPCHVLVLHPPAGIASGDRLAIHLALEPQAEALLTTPGAAKWYRANYPDASPATQTVCAKVARGATLEWLPQESIVFDAARADIRMQIELEEGARFVGLEVLCLGRHASGECFDSGLLRFETSIDYAGQPLWREYAHLKGGDGWLHSPVGLAGRHVCATLLVAGVQVPPGALAACREASQAALHHECSHAQGQTQQPAKHRHAGATDLGLLPSLAGISVLPNLLTARYLGTSTEQARAWFVALWRVLRPLVNQRSAHVPRIWHT